MGRPVEPEVERRKEEGGKEIQGESRSSQPALEIKSFGERIESCDWSSEMGMRKLRGQKIQPIRIDAKSRVRKYQLVGRRTARRSPARSPFFLRKVTIASVFVSRSENSLGESLAASFKRSIVLLGYNFVMHSILKNRVKNTNNMAVLGRRDKISSGD